MICTGLQNQSWSTAAPHKEQLILTGAGVFIHILTLRLTTNMFTLVTQMMIGGDYFQMHQHRVEKHKTPFGVTEMT